MMMSDQLSSPLLDTALAICAAQPGHTSELAEGLAGHFATRERLHAHALAMEDSEDKVVALATLALGRARAEGLIAGQDPMAATREALARLHPSEQPRWPSPLVRTRGELAGLRCQRESLEAARAWLEEATSEDARVLAMEPREREQSLALGLQRVAQELLQMGDALAAGRLAEEIAAEPFAWRSRSWSEALVRLLAACDRLDLARRPLDGLRDSDPSAWRHLLALLVAAHAHHGQRERASSLLDELPSEPGTVEGLEALLALERLDDVAAGQKNLSPSRRLFVLPQLACAYLEANEPQRACDLLTEVVELMGGRNRSCPRGFPALAQAFAVRGHRVEAARSLHLATATVGRRWLAPGYQGRVRELIDACRELPEVDRLLLRMPVDGGPDGVEPGSAWLRRHVLIDVLLRLAMSLASKPGSVRTAALEHARELLLRHPAEGHAAARPLWCALLATIEGLLAADIEYGSELIAPIRCVMPWLERACPV